MKLTAGEFLHPFTKEKIPPPIAPIANAPPQSSTIRYGLGKSPCTEISYCSFKKYLVLKDPANWNGRGTLNYQGSLAYSSILFHARFYAVVTQSLQASFISVSYWFISYSQSRRLIENVIKTALHCGQCCLQPIKIQVFSRHFFDSNMATILQMNFSYISCRFVQWSRSR